MNIENTESQMRKGLLELCILGIIRKTGEAYPGDILEGLKTAALVVFEGTLYPILTRMKTAGLLQYRWEESASGPPRKYYSLTAQGVAFYSRLQQSWTEISAAVNQLSQS